MTGIEHITKKRVEQFALDFDAEHDAKFTKGQLLMLANYLIFSNDNNMPKDSWSVDYLKQILRLPRLDQLAIAGALIAAEIDRRQLIGDTDDIKTTTMDKTELIKKLEALPEGVNDVFLVTLEPVGDSKYSVHIQKDFNVDEMQSSTEKNPFIGLSFLKK
jgi:hypothetical protein